MQTESIGSRLSMVALQRNFTDFIDLDLNGFSLEHGSVATWKQYEVRDLHACSRLSMVALQLDFRFYF